MVKEPTYEELQKRNNELEKSAFEHKHTEELLQKKSRELQETVKKLTCLSAISNLFENPELSVEDILELLAVELVGMVPEDENVILSTNRGLPVVLDGKSKAGVAFHNIARRLKGETVPFLNMDEDNGFFGRLARFIRPGGS